MKPSSLDVERELPPTTESEQELATEEVERLRSERDSLLERAARLQAEFENYRKRQAREQQDFRDYALVDTLKALLPILDSFDRALVAPASTGEFRSGVELINRQLHEVMKRLGVQPVETQGARFDPKFHEAVEMVDTSEVPDHQVMEELQRGYRLKERLLRPAMVRVARNPGK